MKQGQYGIGLVEVFFFADLRLVRAGRKKVKEE